MKRLLLSFAMLLAMIGTVAAETKTPVLLTGTSAEGVIVEPYGSSTMEELYAATFTPTEDLKNMFQYLNMDTEDYNKLVVKFAEPVGPGWNIHAYGGQQNFFSLEGKDEYTITLTGAPIDDFTIFNWFGCRSSITVTECYLLKDDSGTSTDDPQDPEEPQKSSRGEWVSLIDNGTADASTDVESFPVSKNGPKNGDTAEDRPEIVDEGVDGTKCFKVVSDEPATDSQSWSTQFFLLSKEVLPAGTKIHVKFDYKAERAQSVTSSSQGLPRAWHGGLDAFAFDADTDWLTFEKEYTLSAGDATKNSGWSDKYGNTDVDGFKSIAFDLNSDLENANTFYFDNIVFEYFKPSTAAEFNSDVIEVIFPYETNIAALQQASGKERVMFPTDCFSVKVNGKDADVFSVEGTDEGGLYVFLNDEWLIANADMTDGDKVEVTFTNPADEAFRIVYTDGHKKDEAVDNFVIEAEFNEDLTVASLNYGDPILVSSDPEEGSINLPNNINMFTVTFDKEVDGSKLKARIGNSNLAVSPKEWSKEFVLTRTGADLANGAYTLNLTSIYGQYTSVDNVHYEVTFNVGKTEAGPDDQPVDIIEVAKFDDCAGGGIPEGFLVKFNAEERTNPSTFSSGSRMMEFNSGVDFKKAVYFREGYVEYGSVADYELALPEGGVYRVEFNSAMWKNSGTWLKFEVVDPDDKAIVSEMVKNTPDVDGNTGVAVSGSTFSSFKFTAKTAGNYKLRWTSTDASGKQGYNEVLLAKVHMYSIPAIPGWEETEALKKALANAIEMKDANTDERYAGQAYNALDAAITKYDAEAETYTALSVIKAAADDLNAKAKAMKTHHELCDKYDQLNGEIQTLKAQHSVTKFAKAPSYADLVTAAEKYEGRMLTDDEELTEAVADLNNSVTYAKSMFTEGKSCQAWWNDQNQSLGYCVLFERIRQGIETLESLLGVEDVAEDDEEGEAQEQDELIAKAKDTLGDDDDVALALQNRITVELYNKIKAGDTADLFSEEINENDEVVKKGVNMTVFVKNPNIYALDASEKYATTENVPGWTMVSANAPEIFASWGGSKKIAGVPEDVAFSGGWHRSTRVEQTIENLPAGIYSVKFGAGEWQAEEEFLEGSFGYVKLSDTIQPEEGEEEDPDLHFAAYTSLIKGGNDEKNNIVIPEVQVTDGKLTLGFALGNASQAFINEVHLEMIAPADVNYEEYLNEFLTEVKTVKTAAVSNVYFDLQGRRVAKPTKGLYIVNGKKVVIK